MPELSFIIPHRMLWGRRWGLLKHIPGDGEQWQLCPVSAGVDPSALEVCGTRTARFLLCGWHVGLGAGWD